MCLIRFAGSEISAKAPYELFNNHQLLAIEPGISINACTMAQTFSWTLRERYHRSLVTEIDYFVWSTIYM